MLLQKTEKARLELLPGVRTLCLRERSLLLLADGKPLKYRLVDEGRVRPLDWEVVGKEQVTVDGTPREATKVVRRTEKREMYVWIVPGMPVPARILQKEDGRETINLLVRSISP